MCHRRCNRSVGLEGRTSRQQLVKQHAGGVDVRRCSRVLALDLLGREVSDRPEDRAGCGDIALRERRFGDSEVGNFERSIVGKQDVLRFDVSMNDVVAMCVGERVADHRQRSNMRPQVPSGRSA